MKRGLLLLALLATAVVLVVVLRHEQQSGPEEQIIAEPKKPPMVAPAPHVPRKPIVMADVVANAERLNDPDATVEDDLQIVGELLRAYSRFLGEGPEGGLNDEIVACLLGKNPKQITLLGPDHAKLNEAGELLDRFGTPYYFHPISADHIEVRSAGPDQKLWSNDDVLLD